MTAISMHENAATDLSSCTGCMHRQLCQSMAAPEQSAGRRIRLARHASLHQAGDQCGGRIYSIRSGSFKVLRAMPHGEPQVIGFALPPEFLGLNALGIARYEDSVVALEDSEVCDTGWNLEPGPGARALLRPGLHALLAREIGRERQAAVMLRNTHAEQRMADLMLSLSQRHAANGYSAFRFRLPMSRCDLASYLGVTAECVSRLIVQFRRCSLFELRQRDATLLDLSALHRMAAGQVAPRRHRPAAPGAVAGTD